MVVVQYGFLPGVREMMDDIMQAGEALQVTADEGYARWVAQKKWAAEKKAAEEERWLWEWWQRRFTPQEDIDVDDMLGDVNPDVSPKMKKKKVLKDFGSVLGFGADEDEEERECEKYGYTRHDTGATATATLTGRWRWVCAIGFRKTGN